MLNTSSRHKVLTSSQPHNLHIYMTSSLFNLLAAPAVLCCHSLLADNIIFPTNN